MLKDGGDAGTTLYQHKEAGRLHEQSTQPQGTRGLASLEERNPMEDLFVDSANRAPRSVWRTRRLAKSAVALRTPLSKVRGTKNKPKTNQTTKTKKQKTKTRCRG